MRLRILGLLTRKGRLRFKRYRKILSTLAAYGFDEIVYQTGIGKFLRLGGRLFGRASPRQVQFVGKAGTWERIRMVAEELGPTFIKLGQILSNRPDLIPKELQKELEKLQKSVSPFPASQAVQIVEKELGRPIQNLFLEFDEAPLAAASIAQIHRAVLPSGEIVAMKVQRPGLHELVKVDIDILQELAELLERFVPQAQRWGPRGIVAEFEKGMFQELDFRREAAAIQRFGTQFAGQKDIKVPQVYHQQSTQKVLAMEFIPGRPLSELLDDASLSPEERTRIAEQGANLTLQQIFSYGFFHADPHPGNIILLDDGRLCYIDFGLTGSLIQRDLEVVSDLLTSIMAQNEQKAARVVVKLAGSRDFATAQSIERNIAELIERFQSAQAGEFSFTALLGELVEILVAKGLRLPPDLFLLVKSLLTIEGITSALDPKFDFTAQLTPFAEKLVKDRYDMSRLQTRASTLAGDFAELVQNFPGDYSKVIETLSSGRLSLSLEEQSLGKARESMFKASSTLAFAVVLGSLVIGSAIIVHSRVPPLWKEVPVIGIIGFIVSGMIGFGLLIKIIRNRGL
ncbi:MAG: ABC1 kinase family protein [Thermodesulfobacteriota bacterium]